MQFTFMGRWKKNLTKILNKKVRELGFERKKLETKKSYKLGRRFQTYICKSDPQCLFFQGRNFNDDLKDSGSL